MNDTDTMSGWKTTITRTLHLTGRYRSAGSAREFAEGLMAAGELDLGRVPWETVVAVEPLGAGGGPPPSPAEPLNCANPDHERKVTAAARLFWPRGEHDPTTACATDLAALLHDSLEDRYPVEIWPVRTGPANPLRFGGWRSAPDCGRCSDRGRFREENGAGGITEAHCTCKRGRRMSELWQADKEGYAHPDQPEPEPPWDEDGAPF